MLALVNDTEPGHVRNTLDACYCTGQTIEPAIAFVIIGGFAMNVLVRMESCSLPEAALYMYVIND